MVKWLMIFTQKDQYFDSIFAGKWGYFLLDDVNKLIIFQLFLPSANKKLQHYTLIMHNLLEQMDIMTIAYPVHQVKH